MQQWKELSEYVTSLPSKDELYFKFKEIKQMTDSLHTTLKTEFVTKSALEISNREQKAEILGESITKVDY